MGVNDVKESAGPDLAANEAHNATVLPLSNVVEHCAPQVEAFKQLLGLESLPENCTDVLEGSKRFSQTILSTLRCVFGNRQ
jgi:hypothetical protein